VPYKIGLPAFQALPDFALWLLESALLHCVVPEPSLTWVCTALLVTGSSSVLSLVPQS